MLESPHSVKEMQELLAVGLEFPDLGMVKIEPDHPFPSVYSLISRLNERYLNNWDVPQSVE